MANSSPAPTIAGNESVRVWLTDLSAGVRLVQQSNLSFAPDSNSDPLTITVDENAQFQEMGGFGASFTDSSAWLVYNKLSPTQRTDLMTNLFSPTNGIGLSLLRQPLGASDFSTIGAYSYDDVPAGQTDPNFTNFSINHDLTYIVPVLKQALQLNPAVKIIGTPWSPPGWMKTSGSMIGGNLKPEAYGPLATYFVKYIQAYQAQGVPVNYVTVQNEPLTIPLDYPGMGMAATEQTSFIKNYLGPALAASNLKTKILAYDHNWAVASYPETVLSDPAAAQYVSGIAWHFYYGAANAQTIFHNEYPNKDNFVTEASGGTSQGSDANAFRDVLATLVINSSRNWGNGAVLWNMALDNHNGPRSGGCKDCRGVVTIDQSSGNVTYNVDYYALGHASKFLQTGAYRIGSNTFGSSIEDVAFKNPDGSKVLIAYNAGNSQSTFRVRWGNESFSYTLNAGAAVTFSWSGSPARTSQLLSRNGWVATASVSGSESVPANALDGNALTSWSTGQPQASGQWFQVDLGSARSFSRIVMDSAAGEFPGGYEVHVSNDGTNWGKPIIIGAETSQSIALNFPSQVARYIRLVQTGNAANRWSLIEFNVYSGGAIGLLPRGNWTATASVSNSGEPPSNVLDGDSKTRWSTGQPQTNGQWFQVDLGSAQTFHQIEMESGVSAFGVDAYVLDMDFASGYERYGYQLYVSNDGTNWGVPISVGSGSSQVVSVIFAKQTARYIRVVQTGSSGEWWSLHEFNVLTDSGSPIQSGAPTLVTEADSNRAIALHSVLFTRAPFSTITTQNFGPDQRTRVMLFAENLDLLQGENLSVVTAQAVDAQNTLYDLSVEYVGKVPDFNWLSSVIVRLPDTQSFNGDMSIRVSLRGANSNGTVLSIKAP
ncbi:MAG TPA: discoidin domain-containing protein [Pyrinomonadaceae bacterium]|nr:discoidin domain-containing protein [Pyrinomonadaceae bacterium]